MFRFFLFILIVYLLFEYTAVGEIVHDIMDDDPPAIYSTYPEIEYAYPRKW
jgi:hypothetical protein